MVLKYDWSEYSAYDFPGKDIAADMIEDLIAHDEYAAPTLRNYAAWIAEKGEGIWKIRFSEMENMSITIEARAERGLAAGQALVQESSSAKRFADLFGGY